MNFTRDVEAALTCLGRIGVCGVRKKAYIIDIIEEKELNVLKELKLENMLG